MFIPHCIVTINHTNFQLVLLLFTVPLFGMPEYRNSHTEIGSSFIHAIFTEVDTGV